jgi:hypothetical protein
MRKMKKARRRKSWRTKRRSARVVPPPKWDGYDPRSWGQ